MWPVFIVQSNMTL